MKQYFRMYKKHPKAVALRILVTTAAALTVLVLFSLVFYILIKGIPNLKPSLFEWKYTSKNASMMPAIINTITMVLMTLLIAVPFGIGSAIYLTEYAKRGNKVVPVIRMTTETLSGIPSIVYGLFGYMAFVRWLDWGYSLMAGIITLAIMILPTVINISETSIRAVPAGIKSSSLALGASHVQTIFRSILPAAKSGIVTAIVLGVGRAIGEAMAITLVSGSSVNVPLPFNSVRFLTTAIVSEMGYSSGLHRQVLFTIGLVLFVFIMIINIVLNKILKKGADDNE